MVVSVREIAGGADTAQQGERVRTALLRELSKGELVVLSFAGVQTVTSSFINTGFTPVIADLSVNGFKSRIRITEATRQIAESIKLRLEDRSPSFWWGSRRISEADLRIPALEAMAS